MASKEKSYCPSCGSYAKHKKTLILGDWASSDFEAFECLSCSCIFVFEVWWLKTSEEAKK